MRQQEGNEGIKFHTVFSKGEGAVTGEAVDNEQPPHRTFFLDGFVIRREVIFSEGIPGLLKMLITAKILFKIEPAALNCS